MDVDRVIARLPSPSPTVIRLPAPSYDKSKRSTDRVALAVASMKDHTTDEGWQIMRGLEHSGYVLAGSDLNCNSTDVPAILEIVRPSVVVVQDKREWDVRPGDFRDPSARFHSIGILRAKPDIFKLTILKDAHSRPEYHRASADEIGCHAWIVYYHPRIVHHLAPFVRPQHLIRTYHSVNADLVPAYAASTRDGTLLSGAVSGAYPLRRLLFAEHSKLPGVVAVNHPGYHRKGCCTPEFLRALSKFKAAICTCSIYGYALRKIVEATACGCAVVTDLPADEVLPGIDGNLVRIPPDSAAEYVGKLLERLYASYDPAVQVVYAERARTYYDYRVVGERLAEDIEAMRRTYSAEAG